MSHNVIGKFRNAEFIVTSDDIDLGRRNIVHEYPLRDDPYVEDNGKKKREHSISVSVMGDNFKADRDKLIEALDQPGSGTLVHPDFGTMIVSIISARLSQHNKARGKATFSITFIQGKTEPTHPTSGDDTPALVAAQVEKSLADSINDFTDTFSVLEQSADVVQDVVDEVDNVMGAVENVVGAFVDPISNLIRAPANMAAAIVGSITSINTLIAKPGQALNIYKSLFSTGDDSPSIPTTTASRKQQAASVSALHNLVKRGALIEACRASSKEQYAAYDDAIVIRDSLLDELDVQMHADGIDDSVYLSLLDLRVAIVNDIRTRGADLTRLTTHTPLTTLPALVVAHQLYGDASRDGEVVSRNKIRHPGFVSGGTALEVLNV